jgi:phenylalanyl-tRNA synthetase alpha subunit
LYGDPNVLKIAASIQNTLVSAFGMGIERIAMLINLVDIRMFYEK